jgi:thiol-disulfide isomerase/thioredoxin
MAVQSTMLALGTSAPDFSLSDHAGRTWQLAQLGSGRPLVVAFICNHCPFVRHIRAEFARFAREYATRGVAVVAIASNDIEAYPQDGPAGMAEEAKSAGYDFPYLLDESQAVAKAYRAACTPDFFLFDDQRRLAYRGQFDASRPGNGAAVTGADLRAACDAVLGGRTPSADQKPSVGCNIKWKKGNEPEYF